MRIARAWATIIYRCDEGHIAKHSRLLLRHKQNYHNWFSILDRKKIQTKIKIILKKTNGKMRSNRRINYSWYILRLQSLHNIGGQRKVTN